MSIHRQIPGFNWICKNRLLFSPLRQIRAYVNPIAARSLIFSAGDGPAAGLLLFYSGASIMRRFVHPNLVELSILATLAVLAATIVGTFAQPQVAIISVGFPIVLVAMFMGARRTGQFDAPATPAPIVTAAPEAE
jgi:hypothetical protein